MHRRVVVFVVACALLIIHSGCISGRMLLGNVKLEKLDGLEIAPTTQVVGIRGLDRMESNPYQDHLELEFERSLHHVGLFERVVRDDFDDADVDWVIRVGKADLSYRRHPNLAYFPLALVTLTLYIWVGGPVVTDVSYFDVTLHVDRPDGTRVASVTSTIDESHWINLYSNHSRSQGGVCDGPKSHLWMADLIRQLDGVVRANPSRTIGGRL